MLDPSPFCEGPARVLGITPFMGVTPLDVTRKERGFLNMLTIFFAPNLVMFNALITSL